MDPTDRLPPALLTAAVRWVGQSPTIVHRLWRSLVGAARCARVAAHHRRRTAAWRRLRRCDRALRRASRWRP